MKRLFILFLLLGNVACSDSNITTVSDTNAIVSTSFSRDVSVLLLNDTNDANADGIRDDVNSMIDNDYSENETTRSIAIRFAQTLNEYATSMTESEVSAMSVEIQKAIDCVFLSVPVGSNYADASDMISSIEGATFNTKERALAYYQTTDMGSFEIQITDNISQDECTQ